MFFDEINVGLPIVPKSLFTTTGLQDDSHMPIFGGGLDAAARRVPNRLHAVKATPVVSRK